MNKTSSSFVPFLPIVAAPRPCLRFSSKPHWRQPPTRAVVPRRCRQRSRFPQRGGTVRPTFQSVHLLLQLLHGALGELGPRLSLESHVQVREVRSQTHATHRDHRPHAVLRLCGLVGIGTVLEANQMMMMMIWALLRSNSDGYIAPRSESKVKCGSCCENLLISSLSNV